MFELETHENKIDELGHFRAGKIAFKKSLVVKNRNEATYENIINSLPQENEVSMIKTNGLSDAGSIFYAIDKKEKIKELYLATWIINKENIDLLVDNKNIQKRIVILSNRLKQLKKSDYNYLLMRFAEIEDNNNKFRILNSHAKTFSCITYDNNNYTVVGSGNWTLNPRIETYLIHNNKEILNWNAEWMKELIK